MTTDETIAAMAERIDTLERKVELLAQMLAKAHTVVELHQRSIDRLARIAAPGDQQPARTAPLSTLN